MATNVQDATILVDARNALGDLTTQQGHFLGARNDEVLASGEIMLHLAENPRGANARPTHHHAVHAIAVVALHEALGCGHIAIANDGDGHAGVVLHLANERPVGLAGVEL